MDWKNPEKFGGGARGSFQLSANPAGYAVTCTINERGMAAYSASHRDQVFATFYVDDPKNRPMMVAAARTMRAACGLHDSALSGGASTR